MKPCWRSFHRTERKAAALVSLVMTRPPPACVVATPGPPSPALAGRGELTRSVPRQSLRVRNRDPVTQILRKAVQLSQEGTTALLEVKAIPQVEPPEWGGSEVRLRISTLRSSSTPHRAVTVRGLH